MPSSYSDRSKLIKKLIFWSIIIGGLFALFFAQTIVHAQSSQLIDPCDALGGCVKGISKYDQENTTSGNVVNLVLDIVRFLIYIGAAIAVLFIISGGYSMITSNGEADKYKKGLNTLVYAIIGLVVAIISVTIVSVVGNIITNLNITSTSK